MQVEVAAVSSSVLTHHVAHHVLMTNSLTPWLRTRLDVDGEQLVLDAPRAVVGLVPTGRVRRTVALRDVLAIEVGWQVVPIRVGVVVLLAAAAALLDPPSWLGVGLVVASAWIALLSVVATLRIRLRDGRIVTPICAFQRRRARRIGERVTWIQERLGA
jgi:hypothetical protein